MVNKYCHIFDLRYYPPKNLFSRIVNVHFMRFYDHTKYPYSLTSDKDKFEEINSQQHIKQFVNKVKQYTAKSNNLTHAVCVFDLTNANKSKNITT